MANKIDNHQKRDFNDLKRLGRMILFSAISIVISCIILILLGYLINLIIGLNTFIYYLKKSAEILTWPILVLIGFIIIKKRLFEILKYLEDTGGKFWGIDFRWPKRLPKEETSSIDYPPGSEKKR